MANDKKAAGKKAAAKTTTKTAAAKEPKAKKAAAEPKVKKPGIGDLARELIMKGADNDTVLAKIKEKFPDASTGMASVNWYRNQLRQEHGDEVKTSREMKAASKPAKEPKAKKAAKGDGKKAAPKGDGKKAAAKKGDGKNAGAGGDFLD